MRKNDGLWLLDSINLPVLAGPVYIEYFAFKSSLHLWVARPHNLDFSSNSCVILPINQEKQELYGQEIFDNSVNTHIYLFNEMS